MKRVAAWVGLLGGAALNAELLLTQRQVNLPWLLFFGLGALYFQRNGFLTARSDGSDK